MATISAALAAAIGHHQAGRLAAAEQIYRQILAAEPNHVDALQLLGLIAQQAGQHALAAEYIGRAIALRPQVAEYHVNLGNTLQMLGRLDEAVACYQRALELRPDFAETHYNLASALQGQRKLDAAAARYRRAIQLKPDHQGAYNNLGNTLQDQGKLDQAIDCYRQALQIDPNRADVYNNLGNTLKIQGKFEAALGCIRRALELDPGAAEIHNNLGTVLKEQTRFQEAAECYRQALRLRPNYAEACSNLGVIFQEQSRLDEAAAWYRRALEIQPSHATAHSNALFCEQYRPDVTPEELRSAHAGWERQHGAPLRGTWRPHARHHDPQRELRLGFVSPDFGRHPVGFFFVRTLEALRAEGCETVCYSDRLARDEITARIAAASGVWREIRGISAEGVAEQIRADGIDVLFDLAGHTADNRLLVLARKPAPIQITWIGYVGTTGLAAMDYVLADRHEIPPGCEGPYCERVLRMPDGYVCYDPPADAPPAGPLPAAARGQVTFGSFNNPAKIGPRVMEVWAEILRRVPGSRLVLKYRGFDEPWAAGRTAEVLAAQGIDPGRCDLLGASPQAELLAQYQTIDVALDPFPYNGGLTTCEALWMGVPVVTCPGATFAGRHSLSHLSTVGLTETIAGSLPQYVELAVALAGDLPRLAAIRAGLRPRMAASPLCDGPRFARNLLAILRGAWQEWSSSEDLGLGS